MDNHAPPSYGAQQAKAQEHHGVSGGRRHGDGTAWPECMVFCIVWLTSAPPSLTPRIHSILMILSSCNASLSGVSSIITSNDLMWSQIGFGS
jgi:hypothetical protein